MLDFAASARAESRRLPLPPEDGTFAEMIARWNAQRGDLPLPARGMVTFEAMLPMVGRVNLIDVEPNPASPSGYDFVFRLICTARDLRGRMPPRTVAEVKPAIHALTMAADFAACVREGAPTVTEVHLSDGVMEASFRRLLLPYAAEAGETRVAMLAACLLDGHGVREVLQSPRFSGGQS
ncbi:MAG: hypothetical protein J0H39_16115 [Alphaproteobacteria bacterium]|nr:hypothetical protein [Alphaproteobacteria bacterium]MBN9498281.1 hypothetical protein [Alphaproteobacteria bacterium]